MKERFSLFLLASWFAALGCADPSGVRPPSRHETIGPEGGRLVVGDVELSLTVPPGALSENVRITLEQGVATEVPGWSRVGVPFLMAPQGLEFALPAQLVLLYDPTRVSAAVESTEIRVAHRDAEGRVSDFVPLSVDGNTVALETDRLGTFWVTAPDVVSVPALFPLNDGDVYRYDSGLVLTVERTAAEPNLPFEVAKLTFRAGGRTFGLYLDDLQLPLSKLGEFDLPGEQVVFTSPALLIASPRDSVGIERPVVGPVSGYSPHGSTVPAYQRLAETVTEIAHRTDIRTSLGGFHTVIVAITTTQLPAYQSTFVELWLAERIGPAAVRLGNESAPALLTEATVRGRPIKGY